MKPASPEQAVFAEALLRPTPEARVAYLDGTCGLDTPLRRRVEALLRAADHAGDFLEEPPTGLSNADGTTLVVNVPSEKPGDKIGRYKLLQQIGEGGCGVVYMAEQEEPVRRRVALKVIKLGMDTKSVIARFEAERQALALMDHPNIAKVLDGGATQTGRPYFVMELVRGIKITDYCDQNNLPTEERLKLFTQVCQAIQHAHQKGIIHRDIKPSNILVSISDPGSPGCPKVIDFGIAKATTGQRLTDMTVFTAFEQFIGTPAYMSPEQAMMTSLDIDTRTDIYALGVLLYELLTGRTPFDARELMAGGLDAMRRIILEQEPARPSTRLSTLLAAELTTVASHRHSEPARLGTLLRGDLDWIVMKALEKDRTRRYETANGLAADVQRHLNNEPVVARPPSTGYRFQKMVRRNKLAFAAAAAVLLALCVGLVASLWLYRREAHARAEATAQKHKAQVASAKSEEAARFLKEMLQSVGPSVARGRDTTLLREILYKAAERVGTELRAQPETEAEMRATLGEVYLQLADYEQAEAMMRAALVLTRQVFDDGHLEVAVAMRGLGNTLMTRGKRDEAETQTRAALAIQRKILGAEHLDVASTLSVLATVRGEQQQWDEATMLAREALGMRKKLAGPDSMEAARSLWQVGEMLNHRRGSLDEAELLIREALAIFTRRAGADSLEALDARSSLGSIFSYQSKLAEAAEVFRGTLATQRRLFGEDHPSIADTVQSLGVLLLQQSQYAESEAMLKQGLAMHRKFRSTTRGAVCVTLGNLAVALACQGRQDEVEHLYRELVPLEAGSQVEYFGLFCLGAQLYTHNRRFTEAATEMARAVALKPDDVLARLRLGVLRVSGGDLAGYQRERRELLARFRATNKPELAEVIAKTCLLVPGEAPDLASAGDLADFSVKQTPDQTGSMLVKGLADYRRGNFASAINWEQKALSVEGINPRLIVAANAVNAMSHFRSGEMEESIAALTIAREVAGKKMGALGPLKVFWQDWHNLLVAEILLHEADALFLTMPEAMRKTVTMEGPGKARRLRSLAKVFESAGRWDEALPLLDESSALEPSDTIQPLAIAAIRVWFGMESAHAATCQRFFQQVEGMKEAFAADRAAKAFCLRPSTDQAALAQALRLARRAVEAGEGQTQMPFYQLTLGMAEYRNGHFAAADPALRVAEQPGGKIATVRGPARFFRAMSLFQQGQQDAARKLFAEAEAQMPPLPANEKQPFKGSFDHDTMIYWLAYKEAREMIAAEPRRP